MWLIFIGAWLLILARTVFERPKLILNPVFWMGIGWALLIGLYYTCGYAYDYPLKWTGLLYFCAIYVAFCFSFSFACKHCFVIGKPRRNRYEYRDSYEDFWHQMNKKIYFAISLVGVLLFAFDFFRLNSVGISMALHTESTISFIGVIGKIAAYAGIIVWLFEVSYSIVSNKKISIIAYLGAAFYMLPGILTSGRQSILILLVSTVTVFIYGFYINRQYKYKKSLVFVAFIIVSILMIYAIAVASGRTVISNKAALFEYMFSCEISSETLTLLEKTGPFKVFFLEIISYYSHELPMFQLILDKWDAGLFLGMSQFQLISQNLPSSFHLSYANISSHIQSICDSAGVYSHTWRSIAGNCIIDFGIIGGLLFMTICGYVAGRAYVYATNRMETKDVVLLSLLNAGAMFSIQFSPFCEVSWYYPLIWLLIVFPMINSFFSKRNR